MLKQFSHIITKLTSFLTILAVLMIVLLTSCRTDRYNKVTADTDDYRKGDEYIYGEGEPRQTENSYANTPESEKRAIDLRKKMFDKEKTESVVEIEVENTQPADSTVADTTSIAE